MVCGAQASVVVGIGQIVRVGLNAILAGACIRTLLNCHSYTTMSFKSFLYKSLPLPLPSLTEGDVPGDLLASVVSGMSVTLVTAVTTPVISVMSVRPVTPK